MKSRIVQFVPLSVVAATIAISPALSQAAPPAEGSASVEASSSGISGSAAQGEAPNEKPWIKRWPPQRMMGEIGVFGGVLLPSRKLELFEADTDLPEQGFKEFNVVAPDIGVRLGFYPLRFFGLELEGAVMPTATEDDKSAIIYGVRGHAVAQLARWSIAPFLLAGVGGHGVASDRDAVGNDIDFDLHFGGGLKFFLSRNFMLRLDLRDIVTTKKGVKAGLTHSGEILLGIAWTPGRKDEAPSDRDGDHIIDSEDQCPDKPGPAPTGCPVIDSDDDGIPDDTDQCPLKPGPEPTGCPVIDTDGDGLMDPDDQCPEEPGPAPTGCPPKDTDGDGLFDPDDQCVEEPETKNGFEDTDGCPDEVPEAVQKFSGTIEGIYFDTGKATIRDRSAPTLDAAVEVLKEYPDIRIEISGHTDDRGSDEMNKDLSARRAASVRTYLVEAGIDGDRIKTVGFGEERPVADNSTKDGRQKNRRIEFKLLTEGE